MERRGRKRKHNLNIPRHIDQSRLPPKCYWDNSGAGHWYTSFTDDNGKSRRKWIAGKTAKLFELEEILENWATPNMGSFAWLCGKYFDSPQFAKLKKTTTTDYQYCFDSVCRKKTKIGGTLADVPLQRWDNPLVQKYIDSLGPTPSKAKHVHSFIRVVFRWGINRGYCSTNPAIGTDLPKERKKQTLPTQQAYDRLLSLAKQRGTHGRKTTGSCPHYIWAIMEINYLCRARGVETREMTDANITDVGLLIERKKGSRDNITQLNGRLNKAIKHLQQCRQVIWKKNGKAHPLDPDHRPIVVNTLGEALKKNAYQNAWGRFVRNAIHEGVIDHADRFSLHDLKRKGITDTVGGKDAKLDAGGHRQERMLEIYDKSIPIVKPTRE